ncbi:MAG: T9SS type A sorting domain-containing protein, partial [Flavobacterium sp.]
RLTFEINSVNGGLKNTAAKLYTGSALSDPNPYIECDDSSSTMGDDHPKITVINKTPGETLYMRVWEYGGDAYGTFKVSAYDATVPVLGTDVFNTQNFSYYPNPVKDILNISFDQQISHIAVVNLLGQTVIEKAGDANQNSVDMSGLSNGAYLVKVTSDNQIKTIKVIKE